MKKFLFLLLNLFSLSGFGAVATLFEQGPHALGLQALQLYKLSLSTSFADGRGNFSDDGEWTEERATRSWAMGVGAAMRLGQGWDGYLLIPAVQKSTPTGSETQKIAIGDVTAGVHFNLLESLFDGDWYPRITLGVGMKLPSGNVRSVNRVGRVLSGSGDGLMEARAELELEKDWETIIANLRVDWRRRMAADHVVVGESVPRRFEYGNAGEVNGSLTYVFNAKWNLGAAAWYRWEGATSVEATRVRESGYLYGSSLFLTHFPTQFWGVTAGFDFSIPEAGFGKNAEGLQSFTVSFVYSMF